MKKKAFGFSRRGPDAVAEELAAVLSERRWLEFKPLFLLVFEKLRARHASSGGEDTMRLRVYEKLQNMVFEGLVEKTEKKYRGVPASLSLFKDHVAAEHCRSLLKAVEAGSVA